MYEYRKEFPVKMIPHVNENKEINDIIHHYKKAAAPPKKRKTPVKADHHHKDDHKRTGSVNH